MTALTTASYYVAIICALHSELAAVQQLFDEEHDDIPQNDGDNIYSLGRIGQHYVVVACLPSGRIGNNAAAQVATEMRSTFRSIKFALMVGIGGGVPSRDDDVRLGDVVVSTGVIQYDIGKTTPSGFNSTAHVVTPPAFLLAAVTKLRANHSRGLSQLSIHLERMNRLTGFGTHDGDNLFEADYDHIGNRDCQTCDATRLVSRPTRDFHTPVIHYGTIASGNQVMRSGSERDKVSSSMGPVLCFEMEAAGLMHVFPCLVIRGVCDYCDSHKNKSWQPYAAGVAAAYAKELLSVIPASIVPAKLEHDMQYDSMSSVLSSMTLADKRVDSAGTPETSMMPISTVPFVSNPDFVDRPDLRQKIDRKLTQHGTRVALVGLGGIGKTQLATKYASEVRQSNPQAWVLWIHASSPSRFDESVNDIAEQIGLAGSNGSNVNLNVLKALHKWLCDSSRTWYVIIDNADDASFLLEPPDHHSSKRRLDYIPIRERGRLLITTRSKVEAQKMVVDGAIVEMTSMSHAQAVELLDKKLGRQDDPQKYIKLAAALDFIPLAISQAASYIRERAPRCSVDQYLEQLEESQNSRTSLLKVHKNTPERDREANNSIVLTWQLSFEHLRRIRRSAADLLALMSFCNRQAIPEVLLHKTGTPEDTFEDDVVILRDFSFISTTIDASVWEMHRLIQDATQLWLQEREEYARVQKDFILNLRRTFPDSYHIDWPAYRILMPHVNAAAKLDLTTKDDALGFADIAAHASWYLHYAVGVGADEAMTMRENKIRMQWLGPRHADTLKSIGTLASVYLQKHKWPEAQKLCQEALEIAEVDFGDTHAVTLSLLSPMSACLSAQGKVDEAIEMGQKIVDARIKRRGPEHSRTLEAMANLSEILVDHQRWESAETIERQILEVRTRLNGECHTFTMKSMSRLAKICMAQSRQAEAEQLRRSVYEGSIQLYGPNSHRTINAAEYLASSLYRQKRYDEARELQQRALEQKSRTLGPTHAETLDCMRLLAWTCFRGHRLSEAQEVATRFLAIVRESGTTHSGVTNLEYLLEDIESSQRESIGSTGVEPVDTAPE